MNHLEMTADNLKLRGFQVKVLETAAEAASYLDGSINGKTVGFGGSVTLRDMGIYERLAAHNTVFWAWKEADQAAAREAAATAEVYLLSANGLAETGEIINIDGSGNRVASSMYGHQKVFFVVGHNKLAPTYEEALWRARNIAAPKNAQRLQCKTPCAAKADRCYDCKSPMRICRGLSVLWQPMRGMETEVVLVNEELGY